MRDLGLFALGALLLSIPVYGDEPAPFPATPPGGDESAPQPLPVVPTPLPDGSNWFDLKSGSLIGVYRVQYELKNNPGAIQNWDCTLPNSYTSTELVFHIKGSPDDLAGPVEVESAKEYLETLIVGSAVLYCEQQFNSIFPDTLQLANPDFTSTAPPFPTNVSVFQNLELPFQAVYSDLAFNPAAPMGTIVPPLPTIWPVPWVLILPGPLGL